MKKFYVITEEAKNDIEPQGEGLKDRKLITFFDNYFISEGELDNEGRLKLTTDSGLTTMFIDPSRIEETSEAMAKKTKKLRYLYKKHEDNVRNIQVEAEVFEKTGFDCSSFVSGSERFVSFRSISTPEEFQKVHDAYPPTETKNVLKSSNHNLEYDSPYRLSTENNPKGSKLKVKYVSGELNLWFEFPVSVAKWYLERRVVPIGNNFHHYFTGLSYAQLSRQQYVRYYFKGRDCVAFQGGNVSTANIEVIEGIMSILLGTYKEEEEEK